MPEAYLATETVTEKVPAHFVPRQTSKQIADT